MSQMMRVCCETLRAPGTGTPNLGLSTAGTLSVTLWLCDMNTFFFVDKKYFSIGSFGSFWEDEIVKGSQLSVFD